MSASKLLHALHGNTSRETGHTRPREDEPTHNRSTRARSHLSPEQRLDAWRMTPTNIAAYCQPLTTSGGRTDALNTGYCWNGSFTPDAGVPETVDGRAPPDHTLSWSACIAIADGMQYNDDQGRHSELFPETSTSGHPLIPRHSFVYAILGANGAPYRLNDGQPILEHLVYGAAWARPWSELTLRNWIAQPARKREWWINDMDYNGHRGLHAAIEHLNRMEDAASERDPPMWREDLRRRDEAFRDLDDLVVSSQAEILRLEEEASRRQRCIYPTPLVTLIAEALAAQGWNRGWLLARLDSRLHWPGFVQEHIFALAQDALHVRLQDGESDDAVVQSMLGNGPEDRRILWDELSDWSVALLAERTEHIRRRRDFALQRALPGGFFDPRQGLLEYGANETGDRNLNNSAQSQWENAGEDRRQRGEISTLSHSNTHPVAAGDVPDDDCPICMEVSASSLNVLFCLHLRNFERQ